MAAKRGPKKKPIRPPPKAAYLRLSGGDAPTEPLTQAAIDAAFPPALEVDEHVPQDVAAIYERAAGMLVAMRLVGSCDCFTLLRWAYMFVIWKTVAINVHAEGVDYETVSETGEVMERSRPAAMQLTGISRELRGLESAMGLEPHSRAMLLRHLAETGKGGTDPQAGVANYLTPSAG